MRVNPLPDVLYRVRAEKKWSDEIRNCDQAAGFEGKAITDVAIKVNYGKCKYRVHIKSKKIWLPWVSGYNIRDYNNGYAGNGQQIDAIQIYYYTPPEFVKMMGYYLKAKYRVSPVNKPYYNYQFDTETTNGQDGYAGSFGKSIEYLQVELNRW